MIKLDECKTNENSDSSCYIFPSGPFISSSPRFRVEPLSLWDTGLPVAYGVLAARSISIILLSSLLSLQSSELLNTFASIYQWHLLVECSPFLTFPQKQQQQRSAPPFERTGLGVEISGFMPGPPHSIAADCPYKTIPVCNFSPFNALRSLPIILMRCCHCGRMTCNKETLCISFLFGVLD